MKAEVEINELADGERVIVLCEQVLMSGMYEEPKWGDLLREAMAELDAGTIQSSTQDAPCETTARRL